MTKRSGARTGGRILVDQLRIQGCDRIFTVPGESFLAVLDALHDTKQIETIVSSTAKFTGELQAFYGAALPQLPQFALPR